MDFQLIIPCYNEAKSLEAMLTRTVCAAIDAGYDSTRFQLIIVENGSSDESQIILQNLKQRALSAWFSVIQLETNQGYGGGILCGLHASTAPYVGWTHADEQCDPKDAFDALRLLRATNAKSKIIKGERHHRKILDYVWSRFFEIAVLLLLRVYIWEINAQPKVFARELLAKLTHPPTDLAFDLYVLLCAQRAHWKIESIPSFSHHVHTVHPAGRLA